MEKLIPGDESQAVEIGGASDFQVVQMTINHLVCYRQSISLYRIMKESEAVRFILLPPCSRFVVTLHRTNVLQCKGIVGYCGKYVGSLVVSMNIRCEMATIMNREILNNNSNRPSTALKNKKKRENNPLRQPVYKVPASYFYRQTHTHIYIYI